MELGERAEVLSKAEEAEMSKDKQTLGKKTLESPIHVIHNLDKLRI